MKLILTTSIRNVEAANAILRLGIEALQANKQLQTKNGLAGIHIYEANLFRKSLVKGLIKSGKERTKNKKAI